MAYTHLAPPQPPFHSQSSFLRSPQPRVLPSFDISPSVVLQLEAQSEALETGSRTNTIYSAASSRAASPFDCTSHTVVTRAYIAPRSSADLIRVSDLIISPVEDMPVDTEPLLSEESRKEKGSAIPIDQSSGKADSPRTPERSLLSPPDSPGTPLTRENIARLKAKAKERSSHQVASSPAGYRPPPSPAGYPSPLTPLSPGDWATAQAEHNKESQPTDPLCDPTRLNGQAHTARQSPTSINAHPNRALDYARRTLVSDAATEYSVLSIHSEDFALPVRTGTQAPRSDVFAWPLHGPRSRAGMERDASVHPLHPQAGKVGTSQPQAMEDSFMILDAGNSTTYEFPAYAPTISRMSIATDASSRYAPSMAAPSSVARRTKAWARTRTDILPEEIEPEDVVERMQVPGSQRVGPWGTPRLPTTEPGHRVSKSPADADFAERLHPATREAPKRTTEASYSVLRASIGSGDTFGIRRRRWSMSCPIEEGGEDEDALSTAQEAGSVSFSETEGGIEAKAPKHVRTGRASRRSSRRSESSTSSMFSSQHADGLDAGSGARRHAHRRPETYEEIIRHLLDMAAKDKNRIVPSASADLPLKTFSSRDRTSPGDSQMSTIGENANAVVGEGSAYEETARSNKGLPRKIIQILGEGAAEAGLAHQQERRILQDALLRSVDIQSFSHDATPSVSMTDQKSSSTRGLPDPRFRVGQDAAVPTEGDYPLPTPPSTSKSGNHLLPANDIRRDRSGSVDSADVSIADSLTRLLPTSHPHSPKSQIPLHRKSLGDARSGQAVIADLSTHNDLMPEEKAVIMKRMRKLEDRLGARVRETEDGQLFIDQPGLGLRHSKDLAGNRLEHSTSKLASKARAVLGIDKDDDLPRRVLVSPNAGTPPQLIEQVPYTTAPNSPASGAMFEGRQGRVPGSSETGSMRSEEFTSEDDVRPSSRSLSRQRMVKLNRFFGASPTAAQLHGSTGHPAQKSESASSNNSLASLRESVNPRSSDLDPLALGSEPNLWAGKLRQSMGRRSSGLKQGRRVSDDQSFLDLGEGRPSTPCSIKGQSRCTGAMEGRKESADRLQSPLQIPPELAYLVLNEPHHIIDMKRVPMTGQSVSAPPTPGAYDHAPSSPLDLSALTRPSPDDPVLPSSAVDSWKSSEDHEDDPTSALERRKRNAKLSRFFGETISFDQPAPVLSAKKSGKEVINGLTREAWNALNAENHGGKVQGANMERTRAAIGTIRRG